MARLGASLAGVLLASVAAQAQTSVEAFYKGRMIPILISFPPGGSYDTYARLTAAHMGKHIPGNPSFVVQNKPTGGPGALRSFVETAARDGSIIGIYPETIAIIQLTQPEIGKWDVRELRYIGSFTNVNAAFMLRKGAPAETLEDLKTKPTNVGCNNHLGVAYVNPAIMKRLGGFPFNIICGYPGTNNFPVAMERGEIDVVSGAWITWKGISASKPGELKAVMQSGLRRHKDLLDVPLMQEVVTDPKAKQVIEFLSAGSAIGRALIAPPEVPADRLEALRKAFDAMVKDPEFLALVNRTGEEIDPTPGDEVQRISNKILETPPAIVQAAIEASQ
jgi:tripartite-type tricarboxylate transporter receptor subunit TctC